MKTTLNDYLRRKLLGMQTWIVPNQNRAYRINPRMLVKATESILKTRQNRTDWAVLIDELGYLTHDERLILYENINRVYQEWIRNQPTHPKTHATTKR